MSGPGSAQSGTRAEVPAARAEPPAIVLVRVHDRPGALERVLGLLRRRALGARPFALTTGADRGVELALRLDARRASRHRVRVELLALHDVREVAVYVTEPLETGDE